MPDTPKVLTARRLLRENFESMVNPDSFKPRLQTMIDKIKAKEAFNTGAAIRLYNALRLHINAGNIPKNDPLALEAEAVIKPVAKKVGKTAGRRARGQKRLAKTAKEPKP